MPQCRQGRSCVRCFQAAIARWHMLIRRSRTTLTQLIRRVGTLSSCAWRLAETTVNDMVVMKRAPADLPRRSSVDTLNSRRSSGIIGVDRGSALPVCCTSVACCPRKRCVRAAETCSHNISLVAGAVAQVQLSVDALKLARSPGHLPRLATARCAIGMEAPTCRRRRRMLLWGRPLMMTCGVTSQTALQPGKTTLWCHQGKGDGTALLLGGAICAC